MEVKSSADLRNNLKVNTLSMGDSGKGKTFFSGTIADYGKPFIIDAEGGLATACDKEFDYVSVDSFGQFGEACKWYMDNWEAKGYTHLVVDSITRLQQYLVTSLNPDGKITISQWGEVLATLRKTVNWLTKECPTHVHMTAMAMESKDELSGAVKIYPNLQGAFRYDLAGYFDVVLYHDCGEKDGAQQYWVQTQGDQRVTARSRLNAIKPLNKYERNNYGIIHNIIQGE
ncbi:AAA family ATPase [Zhongshania sp.]|uniref:AAA family ATPase n=1 Tax=Zhongshania sp. TaxID=1971902 RepID=UPI0035663CF1